MEGQRAALAATLVAQMPPTVRRAMSTMEQIEVAIQTMMRAISADAAQQVIDTMPEVAPALCPHCSSSMRRVDATRARTQVGLFGDYRLTRASMFPHTGMAAPLH